VGRPSRVSVFNTPSGVMRPNVKYDHSNPLTSIHLHSPALTSIQLQSHPLTSTYLHSPPPTSTHLHSPPFNSNHIHSLPLTSIHLHLPPVTSTHLHPPPRLALGAAHVPTPPTTAGATAVNVHTCSVTAHGLYSCDRRPSSWQFETSKEASDRAASGTKLCFVI